MYLEVVLSSADLAGFLVASDGDEEFLGNDAAEDLPHFPDHGVHHVGLDQVGGRHLLVFGRGLGHLLEEPGQSLQISEHGERRGVGVVGLVLPQLLGEVDVVFEV